MAQAWERLQRGGASGISREPQRLPDGIPNAAGIEAIGSCLHLYVSLDIVRRLVVGWLIADREDAELAKQLIADDRSASRLSSILRLVQPRPPALGYRLHDAAQRPPRSGRATPYRLRSKFMMPGDAKSLTRSVLLAPMFAFPLDQMTLERTIDAVESALGHGDFVVRYSGEDGLSSEEGASLICSFWLVDAKLAAGPIEEARGLFE